MSNTSRILSPRLRTPSAFVLFAGLLLALCLTYYHSEIFQGPRGIHDWAQADRLALAMGYYDDGMNFFRPSTFSEWSRDRVTGVEPPVQAYVAAGIAKLTGRASVVLVFRLLTLGITCLGAFALFRATFLRTRDFLLSAFTPLSLLCSPVTIAYSASFLPDAAALWLALCGVACLLRYFESRRTPPLAWAMAWMALAAFIKTTLALYFLPVALWLGIDRLRRDGRTFLRTSWLPTTIVALGLAAIGGWYLHAQWLNKTYESTLFLAKPQPFESWEEVKNYFEHDVKKSWLREYFCWPQYGVLPVLLAAGLLSRVGDKAFGRRLTVLIATCAIGAVAAFSMLGRQLPVHDYYILSIVFPLIGVLVLVACLRIDDLLVQASSSGRKAVRVAAGTGLLFSFFFADFQYHQRISSDYPPFTYGGHWDGDWAIDGAALLDSLGVPRDARIIAAEEDPPNRALLAFDRKGVHTSGAVWGRGFEGVHKVARDKGIQYVVYERTDYEQALHRPDSAYAQHFEVLGIEGEKVVLRLKDSE